jgi:hypothetical protein
MTEENTEAPTEPATADRADEVAAMEGRDDDRNRELEESPVPDPAKDTDATDDPEAD